MPGQAEDDLDDGGAADQDADLEADDRDHGNQRVPQCVLGDHGSPMLTPFARAVRT